MLFDRSLFIVVLTAFMSGCVTDQAHRFYLDEGYPARPADDVEILWEPPSQAYTVIADFQARGAKAKYMRRLAAEVGADAVIIGTYGGYRAKSDEWASEDKYSGWYSRIVGTAIKYERAQ